MNAAETEDRAVGPAQPGRKPLKQQADFDTRSDDGFGSGDTTNV